MVGTPERRALIHGWNQEKSASGSGRPPSVRRIGCRVTRWWVVAGRGRRGGPGEITVGVEPSGVSSDGTHVWVAVDNSVVELDASTGAIIQSIPVADPFSVSSDGTHVWVAVYDGPVTELDASTGAFVRTIPVASFPDSISSDGTHVWVTCEYAVTELDASTGTVVQTIPESSGPSAISSDGTHVWMANPAFDTVTELDASTGAFVQTIPVGNYPGSISSDGTHVWVGNAVDGTVTELNASTGAVVQTIGGFVPYGVGGVTSDGTHVWVANGLGDSEADYAVTELDASTGAVIQTVGSVGIGPDAISSDGTHVWVANTGDDGVPDLDDNTVTEIAIDFAIAIPNLSSATPGVPYRADNAPGRQCGYQHQSLHNHLEVEGHHSAQGDEVVCRRGAVGDTEQKAGRRHQFGHGGGDGDGYHPERPQEGQDADHGFGLHPPDHQLKWGVERRRHADPAGRWSCRCVEPTSAQPTSAQGVCSAFRWVEHT